MRTLILFAIFFVVSLSAQVTLVPGEYKIQGFDYVLGETYTGTANIQPDKADYTITWVYSDGVTETGKGKFCSDSGIFFVTYKSETAEGIARYLVKGKSFEGIWMSLTEKNFGTEKGTMEDLSDCCERASFEKAKTLTCGEYNIEGFDYCFGEAYAGVATIKANKENFSVTWLYSDGTTETGTGKFCPDSSVFFVTYKSENGEGRARYLVGEKGFEGIWMSLKEKNFGTEKNSLK